MPDPVAGARCNAILDPIDRKACEICRPGDDGRFRVPTANGLIQTSDRDSCFKLVRTFSELGIAVALPDETPHQPQPEPQPQPQPQPEPGPGPQPQPQPQPAHPSWGDLFSLPQGQGPGLHPYSPSPIGPWTGWGTEAGEGAASAPGVITHPFVAQLIPDGRQMNARRILMTADGRGMKIDVEYSTRPSETPGFYILTYSIKRDEAVIANNSELKFRVNSGRAELAFEVAAAPSSPSGVMSVRIVDLMK